MKSEEQFKQIKNDYKKSINAINSVSENLQNLAISFYDVGQDTIAKKLDSLANILNKNVEIIEDTTNEYENEIICVNSQLNTHLWNSLGTAIEKSIEDKQQ